ncbi:meiosis-specific protein MEI4 isoform X4 [Takifugu flavidus]|uniref:meiosis-specific protein MEI4 isoform X4 n=1 Tax=Takifugu flavidus TaxID=433684 RepID=UPI00254459FA|nr:meiosis-specific protein MEI4 isoform X4 [Takifugu flavidus]
MQTESTCSPQASAFARGPHCLVSLPLSWRSPRVQTFFLYKCCDRTVDPASQDLFGPECVVQTDSETPELLPSVPLQRPADTPRLQERPQEVFPHVEFLQSLCALQRVRGDDHGLEPLWFPPDADAGSLLADSVCQLLDSVVKACKDPPPFGPGDPVLQACRVVSQATDLFCSQRLPSVEFKRGVESSLEELTEMLLHRDWSSQDAEGSAIHKFPLAQYHNSFHLFWIVKTLLQNCKVPYRAAAGSDATGFLVHLERRVFLLSEEFPLFSMYMWMIGGLLTSTGAGPPPAAAL